MDVDFEDFYAERVLQFERERKVFRDYADLITPDRNESHTLEWENKKLCNNAGEVKNEVDRYAKESRILESQISAALDEINGLKSAREARQEQITRLSKLSNPVQRDVTYLIEERFNVRETGALMKSEPMMANIPPAYKSLKTGEILQLERRLQHESLKTSTYLQDVQIAIREAEEERYRYRKMKLTSTETDLTEAKRLYLAVDELEAQSFLAVSELLRLRVSILIAQREEVEQLELLQRDKAYFIEKEEKTRQQVCFQLRPQYTCRLYLTLHVVALSFLFPVNFRHEPDAEAREAGAAGVHAGLSEAAVRAEREAEGAAPEGGVDPGRAREAGHRGHGARRARRASQEEVRSLPFCGTCSRFLSA
jgi:hypothetical protein